MRLGSLRSVPVAASSVQGKPCKARNGRWTGRPHRESPRASVSASPVTIYHNACLKTQSDRLLERAVRVSLFCTYSLSHVCAQDDAKADKERRWVIGLWWCGSFWRRGRRGGLRFGRRRLGRMFCQLLKPAAACEAGI